MPALAILAVLIFSSVSTANESWTDESPESPPQETTACDSDVTPSIAIAPATPSDSKATRCWVNADVLYWQPHMRSLDYAATEDGGSLAIGAGRTHRVDLQRDVGFRLEAGYLTKMGWGLGVEYTGYAADGEASVSRPPGIGQLFSTLSHPGGPEEADTATVSTSLDYSMVDFAVSSRMIDRQYRSFDVFGGVRWVNIDHELNATFDGRDFVNGSIRDRIEMDAFGLLLGGSAHWRLASGWFFFGRSSVGILYGDIRNYRQESNLNGFEQLVDFEDSFVQPILNVDSRIGLGKSIANAEVRIGYDMNVLTGVGDRVRFADDIEEATHNAASGDLLLEGLFVRLGVSW